MINGLHSFSNFVFVLLIALIFIFIADSNLLLNTDILDLKMIAIAVVVLLKC